MHLNKHTSWLILVAVLVSACSLAPASPSATATPEAVLKLRIGDGVSPTAALPQSVLSLAAQQGFFLKEGLDAEIISVNGTPSIITAMRSGDVDVGIINS